MSIMSNDDSLRIAQLYDSHTLLRDYSPKGMTPKSNILITPKGSTLKGPTLTPS